MALDMCLWADPLAMPCSSMLCNIRLYARLKHGTDSVCHHSKSHFQRFHCWQTVPICICQKSSCNVGMPTKVWVGTACAEIQSLFLAHLMVLLLHVLFFAGNLAVVSEPDCMSSAFPLLPQVFQKYLQLVDDAEKRFSLAKQHECHSVAIDVSLSTLSFAPISQP